MIHSFIITGFLGVGKSSMLTNTIKNHFKDKKVALIVNEFGEIGVDQNILKNVHSDVIEISEGCICCTVAKEFESGVQEVINKYNPELIFIETSGAAEPLPVFLSLENLGISVDGVICVIDVKNYNSYMDNLTAKYQLGGSNIIILNKTDLVNNEELQLAKKDISKYKEENNIKNSLTGKPIFTNYLIQETEQGIVSKDVFEGIYEIDELKKLATQGLNYKHTHTHIDREVINISSKIIFSEIEDLLQTLPKNIFRVKGMIKIEDIPTPLIVNYSFGNVSYEELSDYDGKSLLVFIGNDIKKDISRLSKDYKYLIQTQQWNVGSKSLLLR